MCKNSHVRILNGRTRGDRTGRFTRFPLSLRETPSTLDYMLADTFLSSLVLAFLTMNVFPYPSKPVSFLLRPHL